MTNVKFYCFTLLLMITATLTDAQVIATKDVDYIDDAAYADDKDLLDIYMPQGRKNVPVIVYLHGGALLMGDKSWGADIGKKVAEAGIGLVSVNYRLSPAVEHPKHVNDAAAATAWVFKNIAKYGGDPQKIYVGGHSAGAYLAALLAIDPSHLLPYNIGNAELNGTVLISPFLYVEETAKDRIKLDSIYQTIWGNDPQAWRQASVSPHIGPRRNNIMLIYADGDDNWRKEQIERFAAAMTSAGNRRVFTKEVPNRTHTTLLTAIPDKDDKIVKLISGFVRKTKNK